MMSSPSKKRRLEQEDEFERWLKANGAWWREDKVALSRSGVVHGLGVVATHAIKKGTELFRVPRGVCFGAGLKEHQDDDDEDEEEEGNEKMDCQKEHAVALLQKPSFWMPLINTLPEVASFEDLPWLWDNEVVAGTELEKPVEVKKARLQDEFDSFASKQVDVDFDTYCKACGVVMSHLNPWFGTSMVPFVYTLNCPNDNIPNVAFELKGEDLVVGRAVKPIKAGEELTQSYGNDLASTDLLYRCGFLLDKSVKLRDVVSVSIDEIASLVETHGSTLGQRRELMVASGLFQQSPWDGLQDVYTVELVHPEFEAHLESILAQIAIGCVLLSLDANKWESLMQVVEKAKRVESAEGLDEVDMAAVVLLTALCVFQRQEQLQDVEQEEIHDTALHYCTLLTQHRSSAQKQQKQDFENEQDDDELLWEVLLPRPELRLEQGFQVAKTLLTNRASRLDAGRGRHHLVDQLRDTESFILQKYLSLL